MTALYPATHALIGSGEHLHLHEDGYLRRCTDSADSPRRWSYEPDCLGFRCIIRPIDADRHEARRIAALNAAMEW